MSLVSIYRKIKYGIQRKVYDTQRMGVIGFLVSPYVQKKLSVAGFADTNIIMLQIETIKDIIKEKLKSGDNMKTKFHEYLTEFRKQKGYTQYEMAEKLGISRSSYTNYENGKRNPDYDVVGEICDILGCSMDELFGRKKTYVTNCNIMKENTKEYYSHVSKAEQPRLAIGVQNFRDLREKHAYYVDKTQFIEEFLESWYQITLITRPRRFGKTLNMSMLAEFLDCSKESADIFAGTKIMAGNWKKEMNQHPVVFLSFLNVKADNAVSLCAALRAMVRVEYERYYPVVHDGKMSKFQIKEYDVVYEVLSNQKNSRSDSKEMEDALMRSITVLCQVLHSYYGKKVFLLLDEYDTPFVSANSEGYYGDIRSVLNGILSASLKGNPFLEKAVLTGIQRIAKENIFSGLNNLIVCTVQDKEYDDCFGFTEEEVKALLSYCKAGFSDDLKKMYDGYCFGETKVYNPWSVSCYAARKKMESYWVNTSENSILRNALETQGESFNKDYETLIQEGTVETMVDFSIAYYERMDEASLWGLLVNAGIVTVEEQIDEDYCKVRVPNLEVWKVFKELTACHLQINERQMEKMLNALKRNQMERFSEEYQRIILELPSYHDSKDENSYHMMMLGMCAFLRRDYIVKSNRESGDGRSDICLYSKNGQYPNLILEFKYSKNEKEDLEELADKAVEQIKEKKYDAEMTGEVHYIGLAHCGKKACVRWEE